MSQTKLETWSHFDKADIPYVAAWSEERDIRFDRCAYVNGELAIIRRQRPHQGTPILGKMDEFRQRRAMSDSLCQVCGLRIVGPKIAIETPQWVRFQDHLLTTPVILEPPACVPCAQKALRLCPGIQRQRERGTIRCYVVLSRQLIVQWIGPAGNGVALDRALAANAKRLRGQKVAGYLKAALSRYREISFCELEAGEL